MKAVINVFIQNQMLAFKLIEFLSVKHGSQSLLLVAKVLASPQDLYHLLGGKHSS